MKKRLDLALVEQGLAKSRSQARLLIKEGYVFCQGNKVIKPGAFYQEGHLEIRKEERFVGRGGEKLSGALSYFAIDPSGMIIADIGASTGGFTDCLLTKGAKRVYCIDVGHDQLDSKLLQDDRVINYEGHNIRQGIRLPEKAELAVVDLSYISLRLVLGPIFELLIDQAWVIALVKPQFEAGKENIGKKGVIRDAQTRSFVLEELYQWCLENGYAVCNAIRSPIEGKTGNVEYFFLLVRGDHAGFSKEKLRDL